MKIVSIKMYDKVQQGEIEYGRINFICEVNNRYFHFSTDYKCWKNEGLYHVYAVKIAPSYKRLKGNINHVLRALVEKFMEEV